MDTLSFLSLILPNEGNYFAVGLGSAKRTVSVRTLGELERESGRLYTDLGLNAYFALSTFHDPQLGRKANNSNQLKSFFIDIDCGKGKPYATKADGLMALKTFAKTVGLPRPTLIDSGRGIHAYWPLTQPISSTEWLPLGQGLKNLCVQHGFKIDMDVPADRARILRLPGSMNLKDPDNPQPVSIISMSGAYDIDLFKQVIPITVDPFAEMAGPRPLVTQLDAVAQALVANHQSRFRTILQKCSAGTGCAQLTHIATNQDEIEEPLWRAGLSIAAHCVDADKAIHVISCKHPEYDALATERKAKETKGPYTCEVFKRLNPDGCAGCTHTFTSPIQLGRELKEAEPGPELPVDVPIQTTATQAGFAHIPTPKFPFPYVRGANGGVYIKTKDDDGNPIQELICTYDLYPIKRVKDPDAGEILIMRLHTPKDGDQEFILPLTDAMAKDRFRDKLAAQGIPCFGRQLDALMVYITKWVSELQQLSAADRARRQFGWLDDDSGFILGDKEIRRRQIVYSPPTVSTVTLTPMFHSKGDFHEWRDVINAYARPCMEARAFAFFMGFGNLLLKYTPLNGYVLSLKSQGTGTGKTTILQAINSIYGHPDKPMMQAKDTMNQKMHRISVFRHIPITLDEATDIPAEHKGSLLYDIPMGRQKNRMKSSDNIERINNDTWATGIILTSNRSVRDDLLSLKAAPEGELARLLEFHIEKDSNSDPIWSRNHFKRLHEHYGHACYPFIQYVLSNLDEVVTFVENIQAKIDRAAETTSQERFWSVMAAIGIAGGIIANKLDLHNIDPRPVMNFIVEHIKTSRRELNHLIRSNSDFVASILQRRYQEVLVINGRVDSVTGLDTMVIKEPRGSLVARFEPDTQMLFIAAREFRNECAKVKMNVDEALQPYKDSGAYLGQKRKRMSAGTKLSLNANTECLWFDATKLELTSDVEQHLHRHPELQDTDSVE